MAETKQYANSYIDPSDNQKRYFRDLEASHDSDAQDPSSVLGSIKQTADTAKEIAEGSQHARVFNTQAEMETWLKDPANKLILKVGDNLYIKDTSVPDFWVSAVYGAATPVGFYYNFSPLETGKVNLSNVVTTDSDVATSLDSVFGLLGSNSKQMLFSSFLSSINEALFAATSLGIGFDNILEGWTVRVNTLVHFGISHFYYAELHLYRSSSITPPRLKIARFVVTPRIILTPFAVPCETSHNSFADNLDSGWVDSQGFVIWDRSLNGSTNDFQYNAFFYA